MLAVVGDDAAGSHIHEINEITGYWDFLRNIDWKEPWLMMLISMHLLVTVSIFAFTRNNTNIQIFLFFILLTAAYFSESINEFAAINWRSFAKQQYFDSNGLFISTVFSIPILLNCMLLIGAWLCNSTQLMSKLKIAQLQEKARNQARHQARMKQE